MMKVAINEVMQDQKEDKSSKKKDQILSSSESDDSSDDEEPKSKKKGRKVKGEKSIKKKDKDMGGLPRKQFKRLIKKEMNK